MGDPHLHFPDGGSADFRGVDGKIYAILNAPDYSFAMRTRDTTFLLPKPKMVHGSFFTEAFWTVRTAASELLHITFKASEPGFVVWNQKLDLVSNRSGTIWHGYDNSDLTVMMKQSTLYVRCAGWEVNATRKPIYNKISGPDNWRIDMTMRPMDGSWTTKNGVSHYTVSAPHGLIGQAYDNDGIAINGEMDSYKNTIVYTSAMAEGAIEGVAADYELKDAWSTAFKFDRFNRKRGEKIAPRNTARLYGIRFRHEGVDVGSASEGTDLA
jgi:hypothetical protein